MPDHPVVYVVDDELIVRKALTRVIAADGLPVQTFASANEFLERVSCPGPGCILLDLQMPGRDGLDLQAELARRQIGTPVVFLSGQADVPQSVDAMKAGAVDFLTKPFRAQQVCTALRAALERDRQWRSAQAELARLRTRFGTLTAREAEVFGLVVAGLLNKQIAAELGAAEVTIKVHRGRVMRKMGVVSIADLVWAASKLGFNVGNSEPPNGAEFSPPAK